MDVAEQVQGLVARAAARLQAAGARDEALASFVPARRVLGFPRAERMSRAGRVWRLGVLLVTDDGRVLGTGRVVRAEPEVRRSVTANSVAEQRAYRVAAIRGGFRTGETVNFDAVPIDLDELARSGASGPLVLGDRDRDREVLVRWSATDPTALAPFERYLAERVDLLVHPPQGS
ncbi:hypothetical protein [Agromyces larvae]|uniref:Glutaminase n=1 Tax=Agromyces larvae TaxID=2929802 RepID=A0ABY4BXX9_9MICO|nr:hypothetical protein [Agromyces larvae]UOE43052.1 hypothetical protein MTO99_12735 [Agromyces larvae]